MPTYNIDWLKNLRKPVQTPKPVSKPITQAYTPTRRLNMMPETGATVAPVVKKNVTTYGLGGATTQPKSLFGTLFPTSSLFAPKPYTTTAIKKEDEGKKIGGATKNWITKTKQEFKTQPFIGGLVAPTTGPVKSLAKPTWGQTIGYNVLGAGAKVGAGLTWITDTLLEAGGAKKELAGRVSQNLTDYFNKKSSDFDTMLKNQSKSQKIVGGATDFAVQLLPYFVGAGEAKLLLKGGIGAFKSASTLGKAKMLGELAKTQGVGGLVSAGQYGQQAKQEGAGLDQQIAYATLGGITDALTNVPIFHGMVSKIGMKGLQKGAGVLSKDLGKTGVKAITDIAKTTGLVVGQNVAMRTGAKAIYNPEEDVLNLQQLSQDTLTGTALGLFTAALGLPSSYKSHKLAKQAIKKAETTEGLQELAKTNFLNNLAKKTQNDIDNYSKTEKTGLTGSYEKKGLGALPTKEKITPTKITEIPTIEKPPTTIEKPTLSKTEPKIETVFTKNKETGKITPLKQITHNGKTFTGATDEIVMDKYNKYTQNEKPMQKEPEAPIVKPVEKPTELDAKLTKLKEDYNKKKEYLNRNITDKQKLSKDLKGEGMRYSAEKRTLIQGDSLEKVEGGLTLKELEAKRKKIQGNYVGKTVNTPDGMGAVKNTIYGKVQVEITNADGTKVTKTYIPKSVTSAELPPAKETTLKSVKTNAGEVPQVKENYSDSKNFNTQYDKFKTKTDKLKSKSESQKELIKSLNVVVNYGRVQGKDVQGIFKEKAETIRTRYKNDFPTLSHEIGHNFDKTFSLSKNVSNDIKTELLNLGKTQGNLQKLGEERTLMEGVADFTKHLLAGEDDYLNANYPNFYKHFASKINEETFNAIQDYKTNHKALIEADPRKRFEAQIDRYTPNTFRNWLKTAGKKGYKKAGKEVVKNSFENFKKYWVDNLEPLERMMVEYVGKAYHKGVVPMAKDAYKAFRLYKGWTGKAYSDLNLGIYEYTPTKNKKGFTEVKKAESLKHIFSLVAGKESEFEEGLIALRVIEKEGQNIKTGFDVEEAKKIKAEFENNKSFVEAKKKLNQYQDALLNKMIKAGIYSAEEIARIKKMNQDYVPFFRSMDDFTTKYLNQNKMVNQAKPLKRMGGGEENIIAPFESIVKNTYVINNIVEKQKAMGTLISFLKDQEGYGKYIDEVTPKYQKTTIPLSTMAQTVLKAQQKGKAKLATISNLTNLSNKLWENGIDMPENLLSQTVDMFTPLIEPSPHEQIITVFENGKKKMYQINDKEIYDIVAGLDSSPNSNLVKMLSMPVKALRSGITLSPQFIERNIIRDAFSASVFSKYGFVPIYDTAKGLYHVIKQDATYRAWVNSGGLTETYKGLNRKYLDQNVRDLYKNKGAGALAKQVFQQNPAKTTWDIMKGVHDWLADKSEMMEQATRVGEFKKGVKKLKGKEGAIEEAGFSSRDLMDFQRSGIYGKEYNKAAAFFNAQVQGVDKMRRAFRDNPVKTSMNIAKYITAPSVLAWTFSNRDSETSEIYQNLPSYRKDMYWNFVMSKDNIISIPKPFELGVIFGSGIERTFDSTILGDEKAYNQLTGSLVDVLTPNLIPTAILPFLEAKENRNFFLDRDIVPENKLDLPQQEQYTDYTTEFSKTLGAIVNFSPAKIDHLIRGYGGTLATTLTSIPDLASKEKQSLNAKNPLGLNAFGYQAFKNAESIQRYYDDYAISKGNYDSIMEKASAKYNIPRDKLGQYVKQGKLPPELKKQEYEKYKMMGKIKTKLSDVRDEITQIRRDDTLTKQQKEDEIYKRTLYMVRLSKNAVNGDFSLLKIK